MRIILVISLFIALLDCRNSYGDASVTHVPPGGQQPLIAHTDFLAKSKVIDVPRDHREAAAALVAQALNPDTSVAAVREILTRAGIRIINSEGLPLNSPASPSKIGVTVYDFQVPILAENVRMGGTVGLNRIAELSQELFGVELPESVLAEVVQSWINSAPYEPENPEAFDAALLQELAKVLPADSEEGQIHLLSFLVLSADIYGDKGTFHHPSTTTSFLDNALGVSIAHAATPCPPEAYDPWDGTGFKTGKTIADWIVDLFGERWSQGQEAWKAGGKANKAIDLVDILDSTLARAALVAGLKIEVSNDAAGRELHLRHSSGGSDMHPVKFTATVRFETPWPGATVQCGPMKGYTIPNNSTVSDVWVEWSLLGNYLETLDRQSSQMLSRGGGGGGATDNNGKAEFRAETVAEPFCPNDRGRPVDTLKCGKGALKRAATGAEAHLDLTKTPPIKFKDLLMGPNPTWATGKALVKIITDVATDIATSARATTSMVNVAWHEGGEYAWEGTITIKEQKDVIEIFDGPGGTAHANMKGEGRLTEANEYNTLYKATVISELCPETSTCISKHSGKVHYKLSDHRTSTSTQPIVCRDRSPAVVTDTKERMERRSADGLVATAVSVYMSAEDNTWHIKANVSGKKLTCIGVKTQHSTYDQQCGNKPVIDSRHPEKGYCAVSDTDVDFSTGISDPDILLLEGTKIIEAMNKPINSMNGKTRKTGSTSVHNTVTYKLQRAMK